MLGLAVAAAAAEPPAMLTATPSPLAPVTAAQLAAKKAWVAEVEGQDFYFWRRWFVFGGPAAGDQFDRPDAWYQPSAVVVGGLRPFFPVALPREQTIDPKALTAAADWAFARRTVAFYVLHRGKLQLSRFAPGMDDAGIVGGHSMTKTLAGILMGFALKDGAIKSLDEPAETYLPEWKGDKRGRITLRQLLWNVAGLEIPAPVPTPDNKAVQLIDGSDVNKAALSFDLAVAPGTVFAHNNPTTQLLALIIERATNTKYNVYLSEKLWRPVGNVRAALRLDRLGGNVIAYCCSQTAPSDWLRIGHLLAHDGVLPDGTRVLPAGWVAEMRKGSPVNPNYGLQIWNGSPYTPRRAYVNNTPGVGVNVHSEPFAADDLFFLDGGAKMRVWMVPSLDLVVARFGSQPEQEFDEAYLPNTVIRGIKR
jgi:CubicO group peptidase (beta-lactamase class C family)